MSDWETFHQLLSERRSIRAYHQDPVSDEDVLKLLEAARLAPSSGNRQPFRWMVVRRLETRTRMAEVVKVEVAARLRASRPDLAADLEAYSGQFVSFSAAPVVIVPVYRSNSPSSEPVVAGQVSSALDAAVRDSLFSVAAAITQMLLAAPTLGLGACWMTGPLVAEEQLASLLGVSRDWRLAALIPVGYPAERPSSPRRRPLARLVIPEPDVAELDESVFDVLWDEA